VAAPATAFRREYRRPLVDMTLDELSSISDDEFRAQTRGSAIRRAKVENIRRNARLVREQAVKGDTP
jgi:epoxyqueuosine reductase QueG